MKSIDYDANNGCVEYENLSPKMRYEFQCMQAVGASDATVLQVINVINRYDDVFPAQ